MSDLNHRNECYKCVFRQNVPGNAHIACTNPDMNMTGDAHGIRKGWFYYPLLFDPVWKTKKCDNFKEKLDARKSRPGSHRETDTQKNNS